MPAENSADRPALPLLSRFALGALGGLLPVIGGLIAVDVSAIAAVVDRGQLTAGLVAAYVIRTGGLACLGGAFAAFSHGVREPTSLVQIGIAAPALLTSYVSQTSLPVIH